MVGLLKGAGRRLSEEQRGREHLTVFWPGSLSLPEAQLQAIRVTIRKSLCVISSPSCPLPGHEALGYLTSLCLSLRICKMG